MLWAPVVAVWACVYVLARRREVRQWAEARLCAAGCDAHVRVGAVSIETAALNDWPRAAARALARLTRSAPAACTRALLRGYDVGVLVAGLGAVAVVGVVAISCVQVVCAAISPVASSAHRIVKRGEEGAAPAPWIAPMIPGWNLPASHIVPLLAAAAVSQVAHEAGHAIAAELQRVRPIAFGLTIVFPLLPIAYVALPERASLMSLTRWERLRIVSAGVYHNVLLYVVFWAAGALGVGRIAWRDARGLHVVHSVDPQLSRWLPPHSDILALADVGLVGMTGTQRMGAWDAFLHGPAPHSSGWCLRNDEWDAAADACCGTPGKSDAVACFERERAHGAATGASGAACLPPLDVFALHSARRCSPAQACAAGYVCGSPAAAENLTWLSVALQGDVDRVVLRGPLDTLAYSMRVSPFSVRAWLRVLAGSALEPALATLADWWRLWMSYFLLVNGTLWLMNMLPIWSLDGAAYAELVLVSALVARRRDVSSEYMPLADADVGLDPEDPQPTHEDGRSRLHFLGAWRKRWGGA
ncbi:S2P endopeptidase [Malassezia sp. CBS 17886]|nr:S2P endopeptidase [Malassezia sp. CBS 17886]